MAQGATVAKTIAEISEAVPHLIRLPTGKAWIDYDREADVLYISLRRPQKATDTELLDDEGILLRYRGKALVGITILDASKCGKKPHKSQKQTANPPQSHADQKGALKISIAPRAQGRARRSLPDATFH